MLQAPLRAQNALESTPAASSSCSCSRATALPPWRRRNGCAAPMCRVGGGRGEQAVVSTHASLTHNASARCDDLARCSCEAARTSQRHVPGSTGWPGTCAGAGTCQPVTRTRSKAAARAATQCACVVAGRTTNSCTSRTPRCGCASTGRHASCICASHSRTSEDRCVRAVWRCCSVACRPAPDPQAHSDGCAACDAPRDPMRAATRALMRQSAAAARRGGGRSDRQHSRARRRFVCLAAGT